MKTICTNVSTISFDNHLVQLTTEDAEVSIRFKDRKDFNSIRVGDEVEVTIGAKKAKAPKAKK